MCKFTLFILKVLLGERPMIPKPFRSVHKKLVNICIYIYKMSM